MQNDYSQKSLLLKNVKGLIQGNARQYVNKIIADFQSAGYEPHINLFDAADMGVPQMRQRVFITAIRKDILKWPNFGFNIEPIPFRDISDESDKANKFSELFNGYWNRAGEGESVGKFKAKHKVYMSRPTYTQVGTPCNVHPKYRRWLNHKEVILASSFPLDFNFGKFEKKPEYICGMSVPPVMMANYAMELYNQILKDL